MGKWIMLSGLALVLLGAVVQFAPWLVSWFGKLPGDIRMESERGVVFIPLTSMILISLVLSLLFGFIRR